MTNVDGRVTESSCRHEFPGPWYELSPRILAERTQSWIENRSKR